MNNIRIINGIESLLASLVIGLSVLLSVDIALASQAEESAAAEWKMMSSYKAAMARGEESVAVKHMLDYAETAYGENAPETVSLTHRYGSLLYKAGDYREATGVLKLALERSTAAYGASGGEAYEINMNIAQSLSMWNIRLAPRMAYYNQALEVLRDRGERESVTYVTTLINIVVNLMDSDSLGGDTSSNLSDTIQSAEVSEYVIPIEHEYSNNFDIAERYIEEATEIAGKLENTDEYISSKIAIAQAKLNVMETADRASVPMGVIGYISGGTESDYYDREAERLTAAIDELSRDTDTNRIFLEVANSVLMEIAWLDEDEERMKTMCTNGALNQAADYPPDRLYEVMEGGMVFAPDIGIRVSTNIFKPLRSKGRQQKDKNGKPVKKPYFIPVCIDGHLMAALIHAPRVTIEEVRR